MDDAQAEEVAESVRSLIVSDDDFPSSDPQRTPGTAHGSLVHRGTGSGVVQNLPLSIGLMYSIRTAIPGSGRNVGRAGRYGQVAERLKARPC